MVTDQFRTIVPELPPEALIKSRFLSSKANTEMQLTCAALPKVAAAPACLDPATSLVPAPFLLLYVLHRRPQGVAITTETSNFLRSMVHPMPFREAAT